MRTRLADREGDLAALLGRAVNEGRLNGDAVDDVIVHRIATLMVEAGARVRRTAENANADPGAPS